MTMIVLRQRKNMSLQTTSVYLSVSELESAIAPSWNSVCHSTYNSGDWVKLFQSPSEYGFDEAVLLCQVSSDVWVAWIPDHGEVVLNRSDFYC